MLKSARNINKVTGERSEYKDCTVIKEYKERGVERIVISHRFGTLDTFKDWLIMW